MIRIFVFIIGLLFFLSTYSQSDYSEKWSLSLGTIFGGALNNENIDDAHGKPMFGGTIDFGYTYKLRENILLTPKISYEFRHFKYSAHERNDTVVKAEVGGNMANIPTYYYADIDGKVNSGGVTVNIDAEYVFMERSSVLIGLYSSFFLFKNDYVDINVQIGEGGLLPDVDSSYNNNVNMSPYELGLNIGGKYYFSPKLSFAIIGTRALTSLYSFSEIRNEKGEEIKLFSTYAKIYLTYYF